MLPNDPPTIPNEPDHPDHSSASDFLARARSALQRTGATLRATARNAFDALRPYLAQGVSALQTGQRAIQTRLRLSDSAFRWLRVAVLAALVVIVVAAGLLVHFVFFTPYVAMQNHSLGAGVTVSGSAVPKDIKAIEMKTSQAPFTATQPLGPTIQITPSGALPAPMTIRFKLNRQVKTTDVVFVATSEAASGPWTLLPATISADGWYATAQIAHLSWLQTLWYDVKGFTSEFSKEVLSEVSGDLLTEAEAPHCDDEAKARANNYYISSSAKDTLYWCFGIENNTRILKIVNRMRYPLEVAHPGFTVKSIPGPTIELEQVARFGSGQSTILYPFEEVDYAVSLTPGAQASISTTYSGLAQSLYQLGFGATTLIDILAWGKAVPAKIGTSEMTYDEWIQIAKTMKDFLDDKDCANAVLGLNPGKFFVDCLNWDALKKVFGWKWSLLSPITLVSSIAEFFRSEFNAIGDQLNGRSEYQVLAGELKEYQGIAYKFSDIAPNAITAGPDGNLWFTYGVGYSGGGIGKITLDGILTKYSLPASRTNNAPRSITKGPDGNLWFTIPGDVPIFAPDAGPGTPGQIGRITPGGVITLFPAAKSDSDPVTVAAGPDGNVWYTDTNGNIGRITPDGHITEFSVPTIDGLSYLPYGGIVTGKDGNIWFAALGGIGKITPNGKVTIFPQDACPNVSTCDLAAGPDGNLWFTDGGNGFIGRITVDGRLTKFPVDNTPWAIASGSDGNLWFTGQGFGDNSDALGRITPNGTVAFPVPGAQDYNPSGITAGPDGDLWLTGENSANQGIIWRVAP